MGSMGQQLASALTDPNEEDPGSCTLLTPLPSWTHVVPSQRASARRAAPFDNAPASFSQRTSAGKPSSSSTGAPSRRGVSQPQEAGDRQHEGQERIPLSEVRPDGPVREQVGGEIAQGTDRQHAHELDHDRRAREAPPRATTEQQGGGGDHVEDRSQQREAVGQGRPVRVGAELDGRAAGRGDSEDAVDEDQRATPATRQG